MSKLAIATKKINRSKLFIRTSFKIHKLQHHVELQEKNWISAQLDCIQSRKIMLKQVHNHIRGIENLKICLHVYHRY